MPWGASAAFPGDPRQPVHHDRILDIQAWEVALKTPLTLLAVLALDAMVLAGCGPSSLWSGRAPQHSHDSGRVARPQARAGAPVRGIIEGFYGKPWSNAERLDMFQFLQSQNLNTYVYAPKGDPYQRLNWRIPYPGAKLAQMKALIDGAKRDHVRFVYSISPGMTGLTGAAEADSITYSSPSDRQALEAKINQLRLAGVDTFMLSFDDIYTTLKPADRRVYGVNYAMAQMQLANQVYADERAKDAEFQVWFVPTSYYGLVDSPYWQTLRSTLNRNIPAIWTGTWVLNQTITGAQAETAAKLMGRKPILWDNYPVNDYTYDTGRHPQLMMGPLQGRGATLAAHLAGYISNPMLQPEASKLALETIAQYLQNPGGYRPLTAWNRALGHLPGVTNPALFKMFAIFNTASTLNPDGLSPMATMTSRYEAASSSDQRKAAERPLASEFRTLAALPRMLPPTISDKELGREIQPWLAKLGAEGQGGLDALAVRKNPNQANRARLASTLQTVMRSPYQIGGHMIDFMQWVGSHP